MFMQHGEIHKLRSDCANTSASEYHRMKKMFDVLLEIFNKLALSQLTIYPPPQKKPMGYVFSDMVDLKCEKYDQNISFRSISTKKMLRFSTEIPLSANLFPLESSFQKHPRPGSVASVGGCRGAKPPAKNEGYIRHIFSKSFRTFLQRIFFFLKCKIIFS